MANHYAIGRVVYTLCFYLSSKEERMLLPILYLELCSPASHHLDDNVENRKTYMYSEFESQDIRHFYGKHQTGSKNIEVTIKLINSSALHKLIVHHE